MDSHFLHISLRQYGTRVQILPLPSLLSFSPRHKFAISTYFCDILIFMILIFFPLECREQWASVPTLEHSLEWQTDNFKVRAKLNARLCAKKESFELSVIAAMPHIYRSILCASLIFWHSHKMSPRRTPGHALISSWMCERKFHRCGLPCHPSCQRFLFPLSTREALLCMQNSMAVLHHRRPNKPSWSYCCASFFNYRLLISNSSH